MSPTLEREVFDPETFSITKSPARRVLQHLHLARADGTPLKLRLVAIAWLPLFVGGLLRLAVDQQPASILFDISVHVRLLLALPLLVFAENLLEKRCRAAVSLLFPGNFAPRASLDRIFLRAQHARDSGVVELMLFIATMVFGQISLWGVVGPTGLFAGVTDAGGLTFAQIWYVTISLPIMQFVMLRWLWHWAIWCYIVVSVARLPLQTIATHPDRASGLGFFAAPSTAFAGFVLASSTTIAGAWGTQLVAGTATFDVFIPSFIVFVIVTLLVGCGPLLAFTGKLYTTRYRDLGTFHMLTLEYARAFDRKWIHDRANAGEIVDAPDFSALTDIISSFRQLQEARIVPFGARPAIVIWCAAVIPMLPLVASTMPLDELLAQVGRALLGGLG